MDKISDFAGVIDLLSLLNAYALVLLINYVLTSHSGDVPLILLVTEKDG